MSYKSRFDPTSERAIRGLKFESDVKESISPWIQRTLSTRAWLLESDPFLENVQLNLLEHTWGDIAIFDLNVPYPIFIECVSLKGENSIFPNHKIKKFSGQNKYYCFGWENEMRFVHSFTWNSYVSKCKSLAHYKKFTRSNVMNLRNQHIDAHSFCEAVLQIENVQHNKMQVII